MSSAGAAPPLTDRQIAGCFNRGLGRRHRVRLLGGAEEPLYLPGDDWATIRYTRDYAASALHELAHWCTAGAARRRLADYGYWYRPPPRSTAEQAAFARVEVPVQALEMRFADAAGLPFRVSVDDLEAPPGTADDFAALVEAEVERPIAWLPARARCLLAELARCRAALAASGGFEG
ncbi:MAG: elongation factor P hydroxylase [Pseudomonadales bacterium]|jgi:elongation factor P hydroxylase